VTRSKVEPINGEFGPMVEMLERLILIYAHESVFDRHTGQIMRVGAARLLFGAENFKLWNSHPGRICMDLRDIGFYPAGDCPEGVVNLFQGLQMRRKKGDCSLILELLQHLCDGDPKTFLYVLCWIALPLQKPGTKMRSALVAHGPQGVGKNLLFEIVAKIYGRYAKVIGQDQLEDKFNDWASQLLFAIGDEVVARAELYQQKNKLKTLITGTTIQINAKMQPLRTEANHVNVVFLSNDMQPMALEHDDRRYAVIWTREAREKSFYQSVGACLQNGGAEAFYDYLLDLPLGDFNEYSPPPSSSAKAELIQLGLRPAERFVREWVEGLINLPMRPCSSEQLFQAFRRWCTLNGVKWSGEKASFTATVKRTPGAPLDYVQTHRLLPAGGRQPMRCFVPRGTGPLDQQSMEAWLTECEKAFEADLARYTGGERGVQP